LQNKNCFKSIIRKLVSDRSTDIIGMKKRNQIAIQKGISNESFNKMGNPIAHMKTPTVPVVGSFNWKLRLLLPNEVHHTKRQQITVEDYN